MKLKTTTIQFALVLLAALSLLRGQTPASMTNSGAVPPRLTSIRIVPQDVTLWGADASQQFLVLGLGTDGLERDVTAETKFILSEKDRGDIDGKGKFVTHSSGSVILTAEEGGRSAKTSIKIADSAQPRPFSFAADIDGIFTRNGCNDSACHGSVKGRGNFKLSIYGLIPKEDYRRIVEGGTFRVLTADESPKNPRINLKEPEKSLLLLKPTFTVEHGGGLRFEVGSADYKTLLNWIKSGAPYGDQDRNMAVEHVEVIPSQVVLDTRGKQQIVVLGHLPDGRTEDLTEQARFVANDASVADVSDSGLIRAKKTGEANIFVRTAGGHALSVTVGVVQHAIPNYPKLEARNYIDKYVFANLQRFQLLPSEPSTDDEFLRRVCLDITGRIPPPRRVCEFLADKDPNKRDKVIETLLNSPEYVDYWSFRFSDLLRIRYSSPGDSPRNTQAVEDWVVNSLAANKPYDQMVRERIAGQGVSAPARSLFHIQEFLAPEAVMPEMVRLYMGRRIECAQCHNHPFEMWTQNQFWGLAAFFGGTNELRDNVSQFFEVNNKSYIIFDSLGQGLNQTQPMMVLNPRTQQKVAPTFLDGQELAQKEWNDPRMHLAVWITSHPYFAEATVNRIWNYFFGRGIVDPVDDFRSTNPPTNPELLAALAKDFQDHGYDLKHLMRTIAQSRTYQLSATPNESNKDDQVNYSHAHSRPLDAAVLLDAISSTTGSPEQFKYEIPGSLHGMDNLAPVGAHAVQMQPDLCPSQLMDAFGRSMRQALPAGAPQPNLSEALDMLAGTDYTSKITQPGSRLDQMLKKNASDAEIIDEFYLAGLTRLPTSQEKQKLLEFLNTRTSDRTMTLGRLVWAIMNSREYAYNH